MATAVAADTPVIPANGAAEKASAGPQQTPIVSPLPTCKPKPREPLTEAQQTKYDWLLSEVSGWTDVDAHKETASSPINDTDRQWLTRECLLRYLRATKWNEKDSAKRLRDTLAWRRFFMPNLQADLVSPEQETGKQVLMGYDNEARPVHYLKPGRQNTAPSPRQVHHLVFMVERVIDLMPPGVETLALLVDQAPSKTRKNTQPGISVGREVLGILQTHYPERLGKALVVNVPWIVWGFYKLITPFIDPLTREKLKFNETLSNFIPAEQLLTENGGTLEMEYDHATYWPALLKLTEERRAARTERWIAGGKRIGELEDYLKGAVEKGIGASEEVPELVPVAKAENEKPAEVAEAANGEAAVDALKIDELNIEGAKAAESEEKATAEAAKTAA